MKKTTLRKILLMSTILMLFMSMLILLSFSIDNNVNAGSSDKKEQKPLLTIVSPSLPASINFAGEKAPMSKFYVSESLDRELLVNSYWHSSTILLLKRANRWFPVIEPILAKNNIPDDFKYLALIESGFTKVVSPRGAAGFWQFMEQTAREYKLEVNSYVDERYNVEKATKAACNYFHDSYDEYENWTLVAASYNAGKRRISESLEDQKTKSYYDLYLNEETSRYIYRILAIKAIHKNPEAYGFFLEEEDLYPALNNTTVIVNEPINNLVEFAHQHGMNYRLLKELNPWLKANYLTNRSGKEYQIKIASSNK